MLLKHIFFKKHLYKKLICLQTESFKFFKEVMRANDALCLSIGLGPEWTPQCWGFKIQHILYFLYVGKEITPIRGQILGVSDWIVCDGVQYFHCKLIPESGDKHIVMK